MLSFIRLRHARRLTLCLLLLPLSTQANPLDQASLTDLTGRQVSLSALRGKTVLVNFWGTWCGPCRQEMPMLNALHQQEKKNGVEVIGIALDEKKPVVDFIKQNKISYPIWLGDENSTDLLPKLGNPTINIPFTLLIDAKGNISQRWIGTVSANTLKTALSKLRK